MNATEVYNAIKKRYSDTRQYAVATEVGLSTGGSRRRIDVVVVDCYNSHNFRIDGIEIKVSKSDLRRELEDPDKHNAFFELIDYYTLACPQGIVDMSIIPPKWGVLIAYEDGSTRYRRRPLALHDTPNKAVPRGFFAGYVRAIQQYAPGKEALEAEYKRGIEQGRSDQKRRNAYMNERLVRDSEKLDEYEKLLTRFNMWGDAAEQRLDEFERFRKARPEFVRTSIESTIKRLNMLLEILGDES